VPYQDLVDFGDSRIDQGLESVRLNVDLGPCSLGQSPYQARFGIGTLFMPIQGLMVWMALTCDELNLSKPWFHFRTYMTQAHGQTQLQVKPNKKHRTPSTT